ncbi:hypothetical protein GCG54_00003590 [Colletotrichum gloeosporioides]|uniref:Uncharacterized protein n=1 Tax=Colletotrichum gloeosporioides TaxID=474922 RepID=A0A8H4FGA6_COLGL|nr:uncharacterized protein GCG54_00003590 [Colletotrichum gloeosporioides]KAF3800691.1 hypothetical protein GCG54_00003590 [Colletotrichum gloeosporioides]
MATFGKMGTIRLSLRGVPLLSDSNIHLYITREFAPFTKPSTAGLDECWCSFCFS